MTRPKKVLKHEAESEVVHAARTSNKVLAQQVRDRVQDFKRVPASEIVRNKRNWRKHPDRQRQLMVGILEEIGFAGALLTFTNEDGSLELVDGELRTDVSGDELVPVLVTDLNREEADKLLLLHDPVGAMAAHDEQLVTELLKQVQTENANITRYVADLASELGEQVEVDAPTKADKQREVPGMALEPHEHYDYLVVLCSTTREWNTLCDKLGLQPRKRRGGIGTSRAMHARHLLPLLAERNPNDPETSEG